MNTRVLVLVTAAATAVLSRVRWYADDRTDSVFHPHQSLTAAHPDLAAALVAVVAVVLVMVLIDLMAGPVPHASYQALLGLAALSFALVAGGVASTPDGTSGTLAQFAAAVCTLALTAGAARLTFVGRPSKARPAPADLGHLARGDDAR
jgi:hypothetical protein